MIKKNTKKYEASLIQVLKNGASIMYKRQAFYYFLMSKYNTLYKDSKTLKKYIRKLAKDNNIILLDGVLQKEVKVVEFTINNNIFKFNGNDSTVESTVESIAIAMEKGGINYNNFKKSYSNFTKKVQNNESASGGEYIPSAEEYEGIKEDLVIDFIKRIEDKEALIRIDLILKGRLTELNKKDKKDKKDKKVA